MDDGDGKHDEGHQLDRGVLSNLCLLSLRSPWLRASVIAFTWTDGRRSEGSLRVPLVMLLPIDCFELGVLPRWGRSRIVILRVARRNESTYRRVR